MAAPDNSGLEEVILFSTLSILQLIKQAQQQHGLRHGDYQRYRAYCARRLRRIRKSLRFTHGHKSVPNHPAKFQPKKLAPELVTEARYLLLPLFDAERCWAYAMQLKQEMTAEEAARKKFHIHNKLRKALQHSSLLENICKHLDQVDAHTKLEAQAYNAWIQGCLHFETQQWQEAMESFSASKTIYEKLAVAVTDEELKEIYRGRCAEMQPQLRYCAYNIGDETAMNDLMEMRHTIGSEQQTATELDKLIAQTLESQAGSKRAEVTWAGHVIPMVSPPKLHAFFNAHTQFEVDLKEASDVETKMSLYEKLVIECRDAIQVIRDEYKTEKLKISRRAEGGEGEGGGGASSPAQLVHSYLTCLRLSTTIQRYLLMIEQQRGGSEAKKGKPQDLIRLYDTVLQNLSEMLSLPGIESDPGLISNLESQIAYFKTFRCYYVGEAYALLKKWPEALALFDRTLEHAASAKTLIQTSKKQKNNLPISADSLDELVAIVNGGKHRAYANSLFAQGESSQMETVTYDKPLASDLETYREWNATELVGGKVPPLIQMPPDFRPMPCKPLFFDLALNHVKFPSLEEKIESLSVKGQPSTAKTSPGAKAATPGASKDETKESGLSGMVKGWFWGGGK